MPCTTILVGKKASADGAPLVSRNEDYFTAFNPKRFVVIKPADQPVHYQSVHNKLKLELPTDPQRYTSLLESDIKKDGYWGEAGINASNVSMSATETSTTNSRVLGVDPLNPKGIGEEDFVTIVLPYIHSAREGVERLGKLLEKYGTYESNGVAFGDANEIWYMETIGGHHWAAKRVPDDCYVAAPNWFSITDFDFDSDDTMSSADLKQMIADNHLNIDREGYNLRHIFGSHNDSDYGYNIPRQWYIQHLFNPHDDLRPDDPEMPFAKQPEHLLTIEDVKYALSSHYQHTKYDTYEGTEDGKHKFRPIGIQRNQEVHVLEVRSDVDPAEAGIIWLAYGPNPYNGLAPFYTNVTDTPAPYRDSSKKFDINNMYWLTHTIATMGDDHNWRYNASLEDLDRNTLAAGRHNIAETDAKFADAGDAAAQQKLLMDTNEKTAKKAHDLAMKCLGDMVKKGSLLMKLNY